ncbi:MAG TPA: rod shape-determining protein MreD [Longimicrobiales bacterium]|nr:rod shape-determining protein MreD [Longimicrobiales bacterium]
MAGRGNNVAFWIFIIILVLAHLVVRVAIGMGGMAPDFLTIALLLGSRRLSGSGAAGLGLALGILNDGLSLSAFGALAVVYSVIGFIGARSRDLFEGDSLLFVAVYIFLGKWLSDVLYQVFAQSTPWSDLWSAAPLAALYAAVAGVIALTLYRAVTSDR